MFDLPKKVYFLLRTQGIKGIMSAINTASGKNDVLSFYGWIADRTEIPLNEEERKNIGETITVNWVIPDLSPGSGGHTTVFRTISHLERMGLHNRIYLYQSSRFKDDQDFRSFLKKYFYVALNASEVEAYNSVDSMTYAHVTVATGWQTAYYVRRFNNTDQKYYFVQDFEPAFYPLGSEYIFAENTYKFGFKAITAGDWLKNKMHDEYGMEAESFGFSCDRSIYKPRERTDNVERIFMYARPVTARRAFELGLLALNEIYKKRPNMEVIFAGWDISNYVIPFKHQNLGTVQPEDLAQAFSQSTICLVMSASNLSLMPLEIMASGSVCATSYGANNEWLLNEDNSILFDNDPVDISNKIVYYLEHPQLLESIRNKGYELASSTDWENEARKVYEFIVNGFA